MIRFGEQRFSGSRQDLEDLSRTFLALQTPESIQGFLADLCTPQEIEMFKERWAIAKLIQMGFPYRIINQKTGASSATISRVSHNLTKGSGELLSACKRRQEAIARQIASAQ